MKLENSDIFIILLRLKSFLLSIIDNPEDCSGEFELTREYLRRKYPEYEIEILLYFKKYEIKNDCEIVFDSSIQEKFEEIAKANYNFSSLESLLENLKIKIEKSAMNNYLEEQNKNKLNKLKEIAASLLKLLKAWTFHNELESNINELSFLEEEGLIKENEEERLTALSGTSLLSFKNITLLTEQYINLFIDYFFSFGGDLSLEKFIKDLENLREEVTDKYAELFKKHGLSNEWIERNLK